MSKFTLTEEIKRNAPFGKEEELEDDAECEPVTRENFMQEITEESLPEGCETWTPEQWWDYYSRDGILTHEEFCAELDNIIERVYGKE